MSLKEKVINVLIHIFQVLVTYLLLSSINMGVVLLLFTSGITSQLAVQIILEILLIGSTSYLIGKILARALGKRAKLSSIISLTLVFVVVIGSIPLNVSIEPTWYKIVYLITLTSCYLPGYFSFKKKIVKREFFIAITLISRLVINE